MLDRRLALLGEKAERRIMRQATLAGARAGAKRVRRTAAFVDKTGTLRRSVFARSVKRRRKGSAAVGGGGEAAIFGASAPHTHLIELGTAKSAAHPFIAPVLTEGKNEIESAFVAAVRRGVRRLEQRR